MLFIIPLKIKWKINIQLKIIERKLSANLFRYCTHYFLTKILAQTIALF